MQKEADIFFGHFALNFFARISIVGQKVHAALVRFLVSSVHGTYISVPLFLILANKLSYKFIRVKSILPQMWNTHTTKHFPELETIFVTFCHKWFVENMHLLFLNYTLNSRLFILKSALSKFTIQNRNLKQYFFNTLIFKCCYCLFYVFLKSNIYSLRCMYV